MKKHEPFKIPIWEFELEIDNSLLVDYCLEFEKNNPSAQKSNQGGYQSSNLSFDNLEISMLISDIEWKLREAHENPLVVSNLWFNINRYKDSNLPHLHPHSMYTGVYYVKTPKDCGVLKLEHPALDLLYHYQLGNIVTYFQMEPIEKMLYIFPSWIKHYVSPNNNTEERISISFNSSAGIT